MNPDLSPFTEKRLVNCQEEKKRAAEEALHVRQLLASPSGRWLLGMILRQCDPLAEVQPQFNSRDYFTMGRRQLAGEIGRLVKRHGSADDIAELIYGRNRNDSNRDHD